MPTRILGPRNSSCASATSSSTDVGSVCVGGRDRDPGHSTAACVRPGPLDPDPDPEPLLMGSCAGSGAGPPRTAEPDPLRSLLLPLAMSGPAAAPWLAGEWGEGWHVVFFQWRCCGFKIPRWGQLPGCSEILQGIEQ